MSEIILKSEISNEEIIKNKGNKKCIFYSDDICRNGDRTRDCLNCARVEYHSLYSLNWDNQERLQKQLKRLQAENEELKALCDTYFACYRAKHNDIEGNLFSYRKALEEIREIAENYFEECGVPDDYFKRNNYSWKQHQIKGLTCKLQQIFDKSNEVLK